MSGGLWSSSEEAKASIRLPRHGRSAPAVTATGDVVRVLAWLRRHGALVITMTSTQQLDVHEWFRRSPARSHEALRIGAGLAVVGAVTIVYAGWLHVSNAATVSTTFLLVVLVVAATSRFYAAVVTSIAAMLCFNFFFLPPVGTLTIADPENWTALVAFLAVSLVASHLSSVSRARTREDIGRRDELARLFDLSRDVLVISDGREAMSSLARSIARRFDLAYVAVALPGAHDWDVFDAGTAVVGLDPGTLTEAFFAAKAPRDAGTAALPRADGRPPSLDQCAIRVVPLQVGTKPIGLIAVAGRPIEPGTLDTLAGVVAIAIERTQLLGERKAAELARQSEALKAALLASIGHDLRTPLTAIRIAATNIQCSWLTSEGRSQQGDVILTEVERLTRLFQSILEMARIDAGAVLTEPRRTHPSEIIAAARSQVEQLLREHVLEVEADDDAPVRVDPRLTATALAHLLENAAQYAPPGSTIRVIAQITDSGGLRLDVHDQGPGLAPADLPHLFDRFYRGAAAPAHGSGTGMGLSIARGLLAAQSGCLKADNVPAGGAAFTIVVPAATSDAAPTGLITT